MILSALSEICVLKTIYRAVSVWFLYMEMHMPMYCTVHILSMNRLMFRYVQTVSHEAKAMELDKKARGYESLKFSVTTLSL